MFKDGEGKRSILIVLLSLFYLVATVVAVIVVAALLSGMSMKLPPGMSVAGLCIEAPIFLFMAYGLWKGWKAAWAVTIVMNVIWLVLDLSNFILGNLAIPVPIIIAAATLVVLALKNVRRYYRIAV